MKKIVRIQKFHFKIFKKKIFSFVKRIFSCAGSEDTLNDIERDKDKLIENYTIIWKKKVSEAQSSS